MIWPNGVRSLHALAVEVRMQAVERVHFCNWRGDTVIELPVDQISKRYGTDVAFVHRADLQAALADAFGRSGLRFGEEVDGYDEDQAEVGVTLHGTCVAG